MNAYDDDFLDYLGELDTKTNAVSKKDEERTYSLVLKKTALKRTPSAAKKCGRILLIAAAVMATAAVTAAASGVNLGSLFRSYFEQSAANSGSEPKTAAVLTDSQVETLNKSGTVLNRSAVDNGTTITVKAVVCDQSSAYILLDMIAPEGTELNRDNYDFEHAYTILDLSDVHDGYSRNQKLYSLKDENLNDNKKSFVLHMDCNGFDMRNRKLQLTLSNLSTVREDKATQSFDPVIKGTWKFEPITLASTVSPKEFTVNQVTHFSDPSGVGVSAGTLTQCTVKSISLSPFSAIVYFTGEEAKTKGESFPTPFALTVLLKDGTEKEIPFPSGGDTKGKEASSVWQFDAPVDLNSVSAIVLGDLEIPVS